MAPKDTDTQKITVMSGGSLRAPRKKWVIRIAVIVLVAVAIGAGVWYWIYRQSAVITTNKNSDTVVDVSGQINDASQYPKGSYIWANLMLNAATYASANGACGQAEDIISQVEGVQLEEGVDVSASRQQVQEDCHA